jgi:hypothetical protein
MVEGDWWKVEGFIGRKEDLRKAGGRLHLWVFFPGCGKGAGREGRDLRRPR